jgi:hypothetical protein
MARREAQKIMGGAILGIVSQVLGAGAPHFLLPYPAAYDSSPG